MYNNSQACKHNKKTKFWFSLNFQNIIRRSPQASPTKNWKIKSAVEDTNMRFKQQFEEFWEQQKTKGGAAPKPPRPPLFSERPKIVQTGA